MKQELLRYSCVIHGKDRWPEDSIDLQVENPATGEQIAVVPEVSERSVAEAVESCALAFCSWKNTSPEDRGQIMKKISRAMIYNTDLLADTICREVGKPIRAAQSEVRSSADLMSYFAEEAPKIKGELPASGKSDEIVMVTKEPVGVVAAITPFNYPLSTLICKLGPALAAGCTVVAKPDENTPVSSIILAKLALEAGLPPGVFNVVTGTGETTGTYLVENPLVRLVTFTGSIETGKIILEKSASYVRKVILELGGNCPAIICNGSPWKENIPAIVKQCFKNTGQYCYRINRIYVEKEIYTDFLKSFIEETKKLRIGLPENPSTDLGPLNNFKIMKRVESHIKDAIRKGAKLESGGKAISDSPLDSGLYFPPTILTDVNQGMLVMREESFGPVVGVMAVDSGEVALEYANEGNSGLAAYLFVPDTGTGLKMAQNLESGSVWINTVHQAYFSVPFGGFKESGLGREKSHYGIEEYLELKATYVSLEV